MNDNFGIKNKIDLYKRLVPALNSKVKELEKINVNNIRKEDIWNYLIRYKWDNVVGLSLSDMVDDILNIDNNVLVNNIIQMKKESMSNLEQL